ncbi:MAG: type II toxin-antitoxin system RelE/ParE family toxin [Verrucomicrobia bacterium]|nr:type II toxin-antitoxin system RelE/ParE family toxin [Verrucomicrobiota bacterium]
MNRVVLPPAADEFEDAAAHYEDKQPGLGQRFWDEVDRHIRWIAQHVEIPRLRPGGYRRVNLKVFHHYLAYVQIGETLWILAIAHGHREPDYWIDRTRDISQPGAPPSGSPGTSLGTPEGAGGPPSVS